MPPNPEIMNPRPLPLYQQPPMPEEASRAIDQFVAGVNPMTAVSAEPGETRASPPTQVAKEIEKALAQLSDAPELTYEDRLKKHKLTIDEARHILDLLLTNNRFEKTYKVTGNVTVTFQTRTPDDLERVMRRIEDDNPKFPGTVSTIVAKYNLAASIVQFKGMEFRDKELRDKFVFVNKMPEVFFRLLLVKLNNFDQMIMDVVDEGAIENF